MATFHEGEIAVQRRAGVRDMAQRVGQSIGDTIPLAAQKFLQTQSFVALGAADIDGRVWATLLRGAPGFARTLDEHTLRLDALPLDSDPLREVGRGEAAPIGLLAIEPATRRRMRLNGVAQEHGDGLLIDARQVYSNCPKYIQKRQPVFGSPSGPVGEVVRGTQLSLEQTRFIEAADTFFIATLAPENGADVSHRGGTPGFVRVETGNSLVFPDYAGNAMFNTLGNLEKNPRSGLVFVDWQRGNMLQLSGVARVNWDPQRAADFVGAQRVVEFEIEAIVATEGALHWHWEGLEASPFNP